MVAAIENQRKERVALARTSFHYKVKALQNKSIAERTHHHSQYMQSAREIRDAALEQANEEWYQIQRGRRALDQEPVDRTPLTAMKRSDLIAHQSAYNTEVSILSGMAKYVGFPAAPEVTGASQSEVDEDLRKMGVCISGSTASCAHADTNVDLLAAATFPRVFIDISVPPSEPAGGKTIRQSHTMGQCSAPTTLAQSQRTTTMEQWRARQSIHASKPEQRSSIESAQWFRLDHRCTNTFELGSCDIEPSSDVTYCTRSV